MAHYAFLDNNNIVTEVIVGKDEVGDIDWEVYYGNIRGQACKRTSYNTSGNEHNDGGTPFRGNYAGIGYTYDETNDVFYAPKPYESWSISESTNWLWKCPVDYPIDNNQNNPDTNLPKKFYKWNEENQEWDLSYTVTYNKETKEWIVDE